MTNCAKNRLQDNGKNRLQDEAKNRPDIILPVRPCGVVGVIGYDGLKTLLIARKQKAWCSRVRLLGLLLLIDFICRKAKRDGGISLSADLAHQFVSKLRKKDCPCVMPYRPCRTRHLGQAAQLDKACQLYRTQILREPAAIKRLCRDCHEREVTGIKRYCVECAEKRKRSSQRASMRKSRSNVIKTDNSPIRVEALTHEL